MIQAPMPTGMRKYIRDHFITSAVGIMLVAGFAMGLLFSNLIDSVTSSIVRSPWWLIMAAVNLAGIIFLAYAFREVARWLYPILKALDTAWQGVETNKDKKERQSEQPAAN